MFTLDRVVPWGRSFEEYRLMFSLSELDLSSRILGCGDGPASFNAEAARRGARVVSVDPLYQWTPDQIRERIAATYDEIIDQTRRNADEFVWTSIPSIEDLGRRRLAAMEDFLADFPVGTAQGRYVAAALPALPFDDGAFDLGLSSHLLFLYTSQLGREFHRAAVGDMCRVCREVRIFPLLALGAVPSPLVRDVADDRISAGCTVTIEDVPYEFQRGGNRMMRIRKT
jgi:SAM-dependent methyltransferase